MTARPTGVVADRSPGAGFEPSRREAVLSALVILGIALAIRVWAAAEITFPRPEDTAYYVGVARNLLDGDGLVSRALWSYGTPPLEFPRPAFEVWLPLPTFLAAIPMALVGPTFAAAQWSSIVIGASVPVLVWRLAADVAAERRLPAGRARTVAVGAGLTAAAYLPLILHSALPDSTMPFAALALAGCLLMGRILRDPRPSRRVDPRLLALGAILGLTALTRNEALWLALAWAIVAWRIDGLDRRARAGLIAVPAVVALVIFAPWAIRDWIVFGNPLPGQALSNALSLDGRDIFAWTDRPTLDRYLAAGPATLVGLRATGLGHDLVNVLLLPGAPVAAIGLLALPWTARGQAVRPVAIVAATTFLVTSLVFPVATTWGTYLHAAGPTHALLIVSAVLAVDGLIAAIGRRRGWTRPVAWLGPSLTVAGSVLLAAALIPSFGADGRATAAKYRALSVALPGEVRSASVDGGAIVTDFPIWLSEELGIDALALPDEPPASVVDLAARLGGRYLVVDVGAGSWPAVLSSGAPGADCFVPVPLGIPEDPELARAIATTQLYRIACR